MFRKERSKEVERSSLLKQIATSHFSTVEKLLINKVSKDGIDRLRIVSPNLLRSCVVPIFSGKLQTRKAVQFALFEDALQFIERKQHLDPKKRETIFAYRRLCDEWKERHSARCRGEIEKHILSRKKG